MASEIATLGGGCFWCLEAVYQQLKGVLAVESGYSGGHIPHPSYRAVCDGSTGHAEVVRVSFDPDVVSYRQVLEVFFTIHDPTTLNRQGNDVGTQYRSIILYSGDAQRVAAEKSKAEAARQFSSPIVTQIVPLKHFYPAEAYHQNYYNLHSNQGYCQFVIGPKLHKLIAKGVIPREK